MSATPSTMLELGTELPAFSLPGIDGRVYASDDFASAPGLLVAFLCPHCPFVRHIRHVFGRVTADLQQRGLGVVGINSNDEAAFPMDGIDGMKAEAADGGYVFPYLRDERQSVAKAFRAACTPDLFLFDGAKRLVAVIGIATVINPMNNIPVEVLNRDWIVMLALTIALFVMAYGFKAKDGTINRVEGFILIVCYISYNSYLAYTL
jgi:peroxiredoxin